MSRAAQLQSALSRARDQIGNVRSRLDSCNAGATDPRECDHLRSDLNVAKRSYDWIADELERARSVEGL